MIDDHSERADAERGSEGSGVRASVRGAHLRVEIRRASSMVRHQRLLALHKVARRVNVDEAAGSTDIKVERRVKLRVEQVDEGQEHHHPIATKGAGLNHTHAPDELIERA